MTNTDLAYRQKPPLRDPQPLPEGRQLGQQLRDHLLAHRRTDLTPDEEPSRTADPPRALCRAD